MAPTEEKTSALGRRVVLTKRARLRNLIDTSTLQYPRLPHSISSLHYLHHHISNFVSNDALYIGHVDGLSNPVGRLASDSQEYSVIAADCRPSTDFWSRYCLSFVCGHKF